MALTINGNVLIVGGRLYFGGIKRKFRDFKYKLA